MIRLLTGPVHGGKTSLLDQILSSARRAGLSIGGIICPGVLRDGARSSIWVQDLSTGKNALLARPRRKGAGLGGRFIFSEAGLELGRRALRFAIQSHPAVAAVDEVGPLELAGKGWAVETGELVQAYRPQSSGLLLLVVRDRLLDRVREKWNLASARELRVGDPATARKVRAMLGRLASTSPPPG